MILQLLHHEDFEDLPEESGARWVAIENIARSRLENALSDDESERTGKALKMQYMEIVTAAAEELGIQGIAIPSGNDPTSRLDGFMIGAQAVATRQHLKMGTGVKPFGFKVHERAKAEIRVLVAKIHDEIGNLGLTEPREKRLRTEIQSFLQELEAPRSRFSVGSAHLMAIFTAVNLAVTTAASGPEALEAVKSAMTIWADEHSKAESRRLGIEHEAPPALLEPPQKLIPGPTDE